MEFDIATGSKTCSSNKHDKIWDPSDLISKEDVEDKDVRQEDQTGILNKSCSEVNLTAESDSFVGKRIPSVDVVATVKDVVLKQEDEMYLCKEVNLTGTSDSFVSNEQLKSTHGDDQVPSKHGDDQKPSKHGDDQMPSKHGDDQMLSRQGDDQMPSKHGDDQMPSKHGDDQMPSKHGDDQMPSKHGDNQMPSKHGDDQMSSKHSDDQIPSKGVIPPNHGMICMNLALLLRALYNLPSASTLGTILVLGLFLNPFCSLSNATTLDEDCLQTSVSGFVGNGEDLVFHCKCYCSCSPSWRLSGGPNNDDLTNNQQVLSSYIDKINVTENPPGVHDYSITLKTKETDYFSSDFTCHNGFATKKINRSELLQHVTPPIQSTVTLLMSTTEEAKTLTMSTPKPPGKNNNSKLNAGEIVGIVVGSLIVVALVIVVAVFLVKRSISEGRNVEEEEHNTFRA